MPAADDLNKAASALQALLRKPMASTTGPGAGVEVGKALSAGKRVLLQHNLLVPNASAPAPAHAAARFILEASGLLAIRAQDADAFVRYHAALQPFYELPAASYPAGEHRGQRPKITGLYLMLLLTRGDYAAFHSTIEGLEAEGAAAAEAKDEEDDEDEDSDSDDDDDDDDIITDDPGIMYPIMLERCLMEGSYDRVWELAKGERLPSEEFGVFSQILVGTIRDDIASCSEKAYPSIPVQNAKNLLFLGSEGAVVQFARDRNWTVRDGRIYFPDQSADTRNEKEILATSSQVIENTIGYARELETIV